VFVEVTVAGRESSTMDGGNAFGLLEVLERSELAKLTAPAAAPVVVEPRCPPTSPDSDGDGLVDACDPDDGNDGFSDSQDPWPMDVARPGDYSTPEKILAAPAVVAALAAAKKAGAELAIQTGTTPPELTGHYIKWFGEGRGIASSDRRAVGMRLSGSESRLTVRKGIATGAWVSFVPDRRLSFGVNEITLVRGQGDLYTLYEMRRVPCSDGKGTKLMVSLLSGTWDSTAGRRRDERSLSVVVQMDGKSSAAECKDKAWWVDHTPEIVQVEPGALNFMCRDGATAYVAGESWTRPDDSTCMCTSDFQVSCKEGP
jgi:hypothetical protein